MSTLRHRVAYLWNDIRTAITNKHVNPAGFNRVYIGKLQSNHSVPIHTRKPVSERYRSKKQHFILGDPLGGIYLTRREVQVLYLICQGCTNIQAAEHIGLSPRTAEYYIKNMRKKTLTLSKVNLIQQVLKTDFTSRVDKSVLAAGEHYRLD